MSHSIPTQEESFRPIPIPKMDNKYLCVEDKTHGKLSSPPLSWNDDDYRKLVMWLRKKTQQYKDNSNLRYLEKITLSLLTGRSSAYVLKLAFEDINKSDADTLIIRVHTTKVEADKERDNAENLCVNSRECFANLVEVENFNLSDCHLVIYEHVTTGTFKPVYELNKALLGYTSESLDKVKSLSDNFHDVIELMTDSYERQGEYKIGDSLKYCQHIISQLPPDLVINGANFEVKSGIFVLKPQDSEVSIPNNIDKLDSTPITQVLKQLDENIENDTKWIKLKEEISFEAAKPTFLTGESKTAYLPFQLMTGDGQVMRVWLGIDKCKVESLTSYFNDGTEYELIFLAKELMTFTRKLEKMGFDSHACISTAEFKDLCQRLNFKVHLAMRHNDLHCGNVLVSGGTFKVIDVGDMEETLLATDIARLEVSLWRELPEQFISFQYAETILNTLSKGKEPSGDFPKNAFILGRFVHDLRKGFEEGVQHNPENNEKLLAYVVQILLYQRYCLLDGVEKVPPAFNVFACHWLKQFRHLEKHNASQATTIFLAEVTDDLNAQYEELKSFLESKRLQVLPAEQYNCGTQEELEQTIDRELKKSTFFVQLLSKSYPRRPAGMSTPKMQYDRAKALQVPILQWLELDLDISTVQKQEHRTLLEGDTVCRMNWVDFSKYHVIEHLKKRDEKEKLRSQQNKETFVTIHAAKPDIKLADNVGKVLRQQRKFAFRLPLKRSSSKERRKELLNNLQVCDVVIVLHNQKDEPWIRRQIDFCKKALGDRLDKPPFKIIVCKKPDKDLGIYEPYIDMHVFDCLPPLHQNCVSQLLSEVLLTK